MSKLIEAATRQSAKSKVCTENQPFFKNGNDEYYRICYLGKNAQQDYQTMIANLPDLILDHSKSSGVIEKFVNIVVQQQQQINELSNRIEELTRANIALKAQENVHDILMKLTGQGSNVTKPEVTIRLTASTNYKSSLSKKKQNATASNQVQSKAAQVAGNIQAILKDLVALKLGFDVENSEAYKEFRELNEQAMISRERSYQGDVEIRFESITGNPIVQAQAEAIKNGLLQLKDENHSDGVGKKRRVQPKVNK